MRQREIGEKKTMERGRIGKPGATTRQKRQLPLNVEWDADAIALSKGERYIPSVWPIGAQQE